MKKIYILSGLMCLLPSLSFGENPRIAELTRSKQEKMERLQKCEGTTKALKIAGLSTIGLTAVGVVGNVVEAQKLQTYQGQSNALDTQITQTKKEIEDKKAETEKKKAAAAAASGPSATPPAATTPTAENPENTLGDTVCNIKCDESYKDKTIVCKTDGKYEAYKCSNNTWTKDTVQTCNDRMIADSTHVKIEQFDTNANTYLFSLPNKNKINGADAYLDTDVCYACERWNEGTWVYRDGKCAKVGYAKTCDSGKKIGADCKADKPHATTAQCKSIGAKSNGVAILTCFATECESGYGSDKGNCVKGATSATTTTSTTPTTTGLAGVDKTKGGTSRLVWDFNGDCGSGDVNLQKDDFCGGLSTKGQWKVVFDYGTVRGEASCNKISAANPWGKENADNDNSYTLKEDGKKTANAMSSISDGRYCWCRATKFEQQEYASSSWVFMHDENNNGRCEIYCATYCAIRVQNHSGFRTAVFEGAGN